MAQLVPVDHDPFADEWQRGVDRAAGTGRSPPNQDRASALLMAMGDAGNTVKDRIGTPLANSRDTLAGKALEYGAWLAARKGALGAAAANVADPLAWGATALTAPIWGATELNGTERPIYARDPATGNIVPTPHGRRLIPVDHDPFAR